MFVTNWLRGSYPHVAWVTMLALGLSFLLRPRFFYEWIENRNPEFRSLKPALGYRKVRLLGLLFVAAAIFFCVVWMHSVQ
jgi:hypothetical protein